MRRDYGAALVVAIGVIWLLAMSGMAHADSGGIGTAIAGGYAGHVSGLGPDYLAIRSPAGTRIRVCGDRGCVTLRTTDRLHHHPALLVRMSNHLWRLVTGRSIDVARAPVSVEWLP